MQNKKGIFIFAFLVISLFCSFSNVYAIDEYGNQITDITPRQYVGGSLTNIETITNDTYIEGANYSLIDGTSFLNFYVGTLLNQTEYEYGEIYSTMGVGVQVYGNTSYASGVAPQLPAYPSGGFWVVDYPSDLIDIEYNEVNVVNITLWIDYNNGSGWLMTEEFEFNLTYDFYENPTPITETDEINMDIIYFWLFVITLFSTSINSILVFKLGEMSYVTYALLSFGFCITFLITLMN